MTTLEWGIIFHPNVAKVIGHWWPPVVFQSNSERVRDITSSILRLQHDSSGPSDPQMPSAVDQTDGRAIGPFKLKAGRQLLHHHHDTDMEIPDLKIFDATVLSKDQR
jgi:hypothetical protein